MDTVKAKVTFIHPQLPGVEVRKVGALDYEVWKDGEHLGNYKATPSMDVDSFADGFLCGLLSAKKD